MNTYSTLPNQEFSKLSVALSFEENVMALHCAEKVKRHLVRQIAKGNLSYQRNLEIVNIAIEEHKLRIQELSGVLGLPLAS